MSIYKDLLFLHGHLWDLSVAEDITPKASSEVPGDAVESRPLSGGDRGRGQARPARSDRGRKSAACVAAGGCA